MKTVKRPATGSPGTQDGLRIALVNPAVWDGRAETDEHLGLAGLAAILRNAGHDVVLLDATLQDLSDAEVVDRLLVSGPQLIGVTLPYQRWVQTAVLATSTIGRAMPEAHLTVGGQFPSIECERLLRDVPELDSVVIGEGDLSLPALAEAIVSGQPMADLKGIAYRDGGRIVGTQPQELVSNLDDLPWASRDHAALAIKRNGRLGIIASRGCYARCTFCVSRAIRDLAPGAPWRGRSAKSVVDEMEQLNRDFGVTRFQFWDDQFIGPGKAGVDRVLSFCRLLKQRGNTFSFGFDCRADAVCKYPELFLSLKEAGLTHVYMGLESGSTEQLSQYGKGITTQQNLEAITTLRSLGLRVDFGFIMFDPYTTLAGLRSNLRAIRRFGSNTRQLIGTAIVPYAGTAYTKRLASDGLLRNNGFAYECDFADPRVEQILYIVRAAVLWGSDKLPLSVSPAVLYSALLDLSPNWGSVDGAARIRNFIVELERADDIYLELLEGVITLFESSPAPPESSIQEVLAPHRMALDKIFEHAEDIVIELEARGLVREPDRTPS